MKSNNTTLLGVTIASSALAFTALGITIKQGRDLKKFKKDLDNSENGQLLKSSKKTNSRVDSLEERVKENSTVLEENRETNEKLATLLKEVDVKSIKETLTDVKKDIKTAGEED